MKYLIVFSLCLLSASKVALQGNYGKKYLSGYRDTALFNAFVFLTIALLLSYSAVGASVPTVLFAVGFALFSVAFQLIYTKALSLGSVALTVMIVNFNMLFSVLLSAVVFKEPFSVVRGVGVVLTILAFVLNADMNSSDTVNKKWFAYAILSMVVSVGANVVQKFFSESAYIGEKAAFVSWSYIVAAVVAFLLYATSKNKKEQEEQEKKRGSTLFFVCTVLVGCILGGYQLLNTYALSTIDGTFFFPTVAGGTIITSALFGIIFFREKLSFKQISSLLIATLAIVLMSF